MSAPGILRIVAGAHRGARIAAPPGDTTRPTAERAREGLFNVLCHGRFRGLIDDAPVADLFAGSGAVGLEALSRGAARAIFVETDPAARKALDRNIRALGLDDRATLMTQDATRLPTAREPVRLLFLDPPYRTDLAPAALASALAAGWLAGEGLAAVQLHPKDRFIAPEGLVVVDDRRYGAARMILLQPTGDSAT